MKEYTLEKSPGLVADSPPDCYVHTNPFRPQRPNRRIDSRLNPSAFKAHVDATIFTTRKLAALGDHVVLLWAEDVMGACASGHRSAGDGGLGADDFAVAEEQGLTSACTLGELGLDSNPKHTLRPRR